MTTCRLTPSFTAATVSSSCIVFPYNCIFWFVEGYVRRNLRIVASSHRDVEVDIQVEAPAKALDRGDAPRVPIPEHYLRRRVAGPGMTGRESEVGMAPVV